MTHVDFSCTVILCYYVLSDKRYTCINVLYTILCSTDCTMCCNSVIHVTSHHITSHHIPIYKGWKNTETRDAGYCPVCNPKNYEVWERRIAEERAKRWEQKRVQALRGEEAAVMREEDRKRAADLAVPAAITATTTTTTTTATTTTTTTTTTVSILCVSIQYMYCVCVCVCQLARIWLIL